MGISFSSIFARLSDLYFKREMRMAMVGLDAAGKTTILHQLKLGELVCTIPTIGFNVETIQYKNISCTVWDVGGQTVIRPLWQHYFQNTQALIFVIDSNDRARLEEAKEEVTNVMMDDNLRNVPLLIFANKQDLQGVLTVGEIATKLNLNSFMGRREWHIQPCSAVTKEGLYEGFEWLSTLKMEPDTRGKF